MIYRHQPSPGIRIGSADNVAFFQLKTMLQGVLSRGTARSIGAYAPYVGGKTGTSNEENDAWFVGFTNDVTVAVWVGYDNAEGKARTLGTGATGGQIAVPIFDPIIKAVWQHHSPKVALAPPSPEAKRHLAAVGRGDAIEYFRLDAKGRQTNTESKLVARSRSNQKSERQEASRRDSKKQQEASRRTRKVQKNTVARQSAPAWTNGWSWREDSHRGNWGHSSAQGGWSNNYGQRFW